MEDLTVPLSVEAKVGVFFIVGLVILGVVTFKVEDMSALFRAKKTMYAHFEHASGINPGDPVAIAGVKVGEVKALELDDRGVRMTLSLNSSARVREDAIASVAWGGLLGNRYIDISLGSTGAGFLEEGSELPTVPSIEITAVLGKLDAAASELQKVLAEGGVGEKVGSLLDNLMKISEDMAQGKGTLGKLVDSPEMYDKLTGIADDLQEMATRLRGVVEKNEGRLDSIFASLEEAVPEARDAFATIKRLGEQAESGKGILPALLNDEQMYTDLKGSLAKLGTSLDRIDLVTTDISEGRGLLGRLAKDEKMADDFAQSLASLRAVAERIETGDNTLARLTRDDDLYLQAKGMLDDARESLRGLKEQVPLGTFGSVLLSAF
jgi:phospholipid/cholesterol/gamma-HCH transport system substrate-binding protein